MLKVGIVRARNQMGFLSSEALTMWDVKKCLCKDVTASANLVLQIVSAGWKLS